jgi:hypothetical protein
MPLYLVWAALLVAVLIVAGIVWLAMRGIDAVSDRRAARRPNEPAKPDDELPKLILPHTATNPRRLARKRRGFACVVIALNGPRTATEWIPGLPATLVGPGTQGLRGAFPANSGRSSRAVGLRLLLWKHGLILIADSVFNRDLAERCPASRPRYHRYYPA